MARRNHKPIEVGTAGIVGIAIFLLAWNVVELVSGTGPKSSAPPGTTYHAANMAGATVTPSEQPSVLEQ
jgi:hypothetical protein